jgi:hypothetical protein
MRILQDRRAGETGCRQQGRRNRFPKANLPLSLRSSRSGGRKKSFFSHFLMYACISIKGLSDF